MIKIIRYDLKAGFRTVYNKILMYIGVIVLINVIGSHSINQFAETGGLTPDVLDYICFVVGGPRYIPKGMIDMYQIPVLWLIIQVMIAYTVGYYAITDLNSYGQQVLLRSVSRRKWWISKIIWNMLTVIFMYVLLFLITIGTAFVSGAKWEWILTEPIAQNVCNITMLSGTNREIVMILMIMPVLVTAVLSLLQVTVALIVSPIIGFIVSQSIVFLATIYDLKWLISNYAMLSHNKLTCMSEIDCKEGILLCFIFYIIALMAGTGYFTHCNILPKNREV